MSALEQLDSALGVLRDQQDEAITEYLAFAIETVENDTGNLDIDRAQSVSALAGKSLADFKAMCEALYSRRRSSDNMREAKAMENEAQEMRNEFKARRAKLQEETARLQKEWEAEAESLAQLRQNWQWKARQAKDYMRFAVEDLQSTAADNASNEFDWKQSAIIDHRPIEEGLKEMEKKFQEYLSGASDTKFPY